MKKELLLFIAYLTIKLTESGEHFLELRYESILINFNSSAFTEFYECLCSDFIYTCQTTSSPFHYFPTIPVTQGNPYTANVDVTKNTTSASDSKVLAKSCSIFVTKSLFYILYYVNITCSKTMSPKSIVSTFSSTNSKTCDKKTVDVFWDRNVTVVFPKGQTTTGISLTDTISVSTVASGYTISTTKQSTKISTSVSDTTNTTKQITAISTTVFNTSAISTDDVISTSAGVQQTEFIATYGSTSVPTLLVTITSLPTTSVRTTSVPISVPTTLVSKPISTTPVPTTVTTTPVFTLHASTTFVPTISVPTPVPTTPIPTTPVTTTTVLTTVPTSSFPTPIPTHIPTSPDPTVVSTPLPTPVATLVTTPILTTQVPTSVPTSVPTTFFPTKPVTTFPVPSTPDSNTPDLVVPNRTIIYIIIGVIIGITAFLVVLVTFCYVFRRRKNDPVGCFKIMLTKHNFF